MDTMQIWGQYRGAGCNPHQKGSYSAHICYFLLGYWVLPPPRQATTCWQDILLCLELFSKPSFISISKSSLKGRKKNQQKHSSHPGAPSFQIKEKWKCWLFSHVGLFVTPWATAHQAPPSMGFSKEEYWSGLPFPSLGDLLNPGIDLRSPALQADSLPAEPPGKPHAP